MSAAKALEWAKKQAAASREVRDLTRSISEAPSCPNRTPRSGHSCLELAYGGITPHGMDGTEAGYYGHSPEYMAPEKVAQAVAACQPCSHLHELIQKRKAARRELGIARSTLTRIGRHALTQEAAA